MTIRSLLICFAIALTAVLNFKCASTNNYSKLRAVTIVMPGEVYSTYNMDESEKAKVTEAANKSKTSPDYVFSKAQETGWPKPLNDFSYRIDNPKEIEALKVRIFADMGEDKYLLIVPAKENKGSALNITEDIFMVYRKVAVK